MLATIGTISSSYRQALGYYRTVTLDMPASSLTDFPVLFSGTFTYLKTEANGGKVKNANGYDIVFYSDAALTTILDFERVSWSATTGAVEFWVKVPTLSSSSNTVIYLAYGSPNISTDQQDAVNTWSNNFVAVYHLPDGTTLSADDSKGVNDGTISNTVAVTGQIDGGGDGNGGSNNIDIGTDASLNITSNITMSAWINTTATGAEVLIGGYNSSSPFNGYGLAINITTSGKINAWSGSSWATSSASVNTGSWVHVVATHDGTSYIFYVDGSSSGSASVQTPNSYTGTRKLFAVSDGSNSWTQKADEIRISNVLRSADWINTEYSNQNDPANFYTIGDETPV